MITVAMTAYNGERYVAKQLESILSQILVPDEIIICDDCSSDDTIRILQRYATMEPSRIKLFINDNNIGYKKNFEKAIQNSNGDIIFLCDQDDIWAPNKVYEMFEVIENHPEIYVLNSAIDIIDSNGISKPFVSLNHNKSNCDLVPYKMKEGELQKIDYLTIKRGNISPGCSLCFKKEIKEIFLAVYDSYWPHDLCINIIGSLVDGLYFYNKELTHYRLHSNNTIGLSFQNSPSDMSIIDKIEKDIMTVRHDYSIISEIHNKNQLCQYEDMICNRWLALSKHSLSKYVVLLTNKDYWRYTTIKQKFIDLVACLSKGL